MKEINKKPIKDKREHIMIRLAPVMVLKKKKKYLFLSASWGVETQKRNHPQF